MGRKVKTSIYIDEDVWLSLREKAVRLGVDVSDLLEVIVRENLEIGLLELLDVAVKDYNAPIELEPIDLGTESSSIVRELRDGRANKLLGQ